MARAFRFYIFGVLAVLFCRPVHPLAAVEAGASPLEAASHYIDEGLLDRAEKLLFPLLSATAEDPEIAYQLARLYLHRGDGRNGLDWMRQAVALRPDEARYQAGLGTAYGRRILEVNWLRKAAMARRITGSYERAIELDPTLPEPWFGLIEFHLHAPSIAGGSIAQARRLASRFRETDSFHGALAFARIAFHEEDNSSALEYLQEAVSAKPEERAGHFALAVLANNTGDFDLALAALETLLSRDPPDLGAHYQLGKWSALSGRQLARGGESLHFYLSMEQRSSEPSHAHAFWRLGLILRHQGDCDASRLAFQEALSLDPGLEEARRALAETDP